MAKARYEIVDFAGEVAYDADTIDADPAVRGGFMTAREFARWLARETSDPEAPGPHVARKVQ